MVESPRVNAGGGPSSYRSLLGNLRAHIRAYVAKQLLLPRQEIREIIAANARAAAWFGMAAALALLGLFGLVILLVALLALLPREWLGTAAFALAAGVGSGLLVAGIASRRLGTALVAILAGAAVAGLGFLAYVFVPQLVLASLLVVLALFAVAGLAAVVGYRKLVLRGPERSIRSMKETVSWVKATLLGRSES